MGALGSLDVIFYHLGLKFCMMTYWNAALADVGHAVIAAG